MQVSKALKVLQVSLALWAPQEPLEKAVMEFQDNQVPPGQLAPPDTLMLVNLAALAPQANPEALVNPVREVVQEQLELWAHEELLEHQEHLDLLDFHLLASLVLLAFLERWDIEESLV